MDLLAVRRVKSRLNNAFDAIGCLRIVRRARPDPPMAGTRAMWKPSNNATNLSGGVPTLDEDRVRFTSAPTGAVGHPRVSRKTADAQRFVISLVEAIISRVHLHKKQDNSPGGQASE